MADATTATWQATAAQAQDSAKSFRNALEESKIEIMELRATVAGLEEAFDRQRGGLPRVVSSLIEALRNHLRAGVSFEDASGIVLAMYGVPVEAPAPDAQAYCPPPPEGVVCLQDQSGTRHEGLRGPQTEPDAHGDTRVSPSSFGVPDGRTSLDRANRHHADLAHK
jgi:hypothetical protein